MDPRQRISTAFPAYSQDRFRVLLKKLGASQGHFSRYRNLLLESTRWWSHCSKTCCRPCAVIQPFVDERPPSRKHCQQQRKYLLELVMEAWNPHSRQPYESQVDECLLSRCSIKITHQLLHSSATWRFGRSIAKPLYINSTFFMYYTQATSSICSFIIATVTS
jgi:hypothetical protein